MVERYWPVPQIIGWQVPSVFMKPGLHTHWFYNRIRFEEELQDRQFEALSLQVVQVASQAVHVFECSK